MNSIYSIPTTLAALKHKLKSFPFFIDNPSKQKVFENIRDEQIIPHILVSDTIDIIDENLYFGFFNPKTNYNQLAIALNAVAFPQPKNWDFLHLIKDIEKYGLEKATKELINEGCFYKI